MMSHRILPAALLLCIVAAACGELPTSGDTPAQAAGAVYDGGPGAGSGNSAVQSGVFGLGGGADEEDEFTTGAGGTTTTTNTTNSGDTAERGGYTMGSGG